MKKTMVSFLVMSVIAALPIAVLANGFSPISYQQTLVGGQTCTIQLYTGVVYTPSMVWQPLKTCFTYTESCGTRFTKCIQTSYNTPQYVPTGDPNVSKASLLAQWTVNIPYGDGLLYQVNWMSGYGATVSCGQNS